MNMESTPYPALPVIVVDDEIQALKSCELMLCSGGIENILTCPDSRELRELLAAHEPSVILLDLFMPHISGEELMPLISRDFPHVPVIVVTGQNDVDTAVTCMKAGAFDYLVKPVEKSRMISCVRRAVEIRELRHEYSVLSRRMLSDELENPGMFSRIVTNSPKMRSIFRYMEAVAGTTRPVLITGETGVGKELIANIIHQLSGRKGGFIALNAAGLDDNVFSDTLFGHVKGAFTGAGSLRSGLVEKAAGGTLFLDEIGDLSMISQVKLLRLLQEREYLPMGADVPKFTDARVIASTNRDLHTLQNKGLFRKDLYYRLKTHHIHVPPLRERPGDLPILVDHFLEKSSRSLGKKKPTPPPELLTLLSTYHFPGNVRELEAMIDDAVSNHRSGKLSMEVFKRHIRKISPGKEQRERTVLDSGREFFSCCATLPTLKEASHFLIEEALRRSKGNQTIAAQLLGITQSALSKRLKRDVNKGKGC